MTGYFIEDSVCALLANLDLGFEVAEEIANTCASRGEIESRTILTDEMISSLLLDAASQGRAASYIRLTFDTPPIARQTLRTLCLSHQIGHSGQVLSGVDARA